MLKYQSASHTELRGGRVEVKQRRRGRYGEE